MVKRLFTVKSVPGQGRPSKWSHLRFRDLARRTRPERALSLFEKSLQLAPDQTEIKALLEKSRKPINR